MGADAVDQFGQGFFIDLFLPLAHRRSRRHFCPFHPVLVVRGQRGKTFHCADFIEGLKKVLRLSTLPALINRRTPSALKVFNSSAKAFRASVTACAEAARSSPRKLQSRSHTTLPEPKKGSVCIASRKRPMRFRASLLLDTVASMISWSMPLSSSDQSW